VWEAAAKVSADDFIPGLADQDGRTGMDAHVGERGVRLSGGQRQRLALARAFYREARFLVLDEATSALDNRTESEVMDAIELIGRRCTLVVIAHRLSTVMRSDCIYEFERGRIKAAGSFEQLRQASETFNDLASLERRVGREAVS
ncbi:MAG: ATP-binding cassette domain-containing protein, partial [Cyanobacteriota bacterium]|nr:ATP-binding cassette domain-containing protein [Cyanobacteriota bacterium]